MPWTIEDVDDFISGLTERQKRKWVKMANGVYEDCMEEEGNDDLCSERAIRIANDRYNQVELEAGGMTERKMLARVTVEPVPGDIRPDKHNGRDHLVIPVVALREAVVKGQFLPGQEIKNSVQLWDDQPVPIGHPEGSSARQQRIVDKTSLGRFYNVHYDQKLKGEIWVDEEKAINARTQNDAKAQELWGTYQRLKAGEPMDVSTSYWHDVLDETGMYNGKPYDGVQVNLKPDHLAVLPDQRGELSLPDGVGVPLKNIRGDADVKTELQEVRETPRDPVYSETTEGSWSRRTLQEYANERGWGEVDGVADLTEDQKETAAGSSLLGSAAATTWSGLTFFQVVDGNGTLYKSALVAVRGGRGAQADLPSDVYDRAQEKAQQILRSVFDVEYSENEAGLIHRIINTFRGDTMEKQELVKELMEKGVDIPEGDLLDMPESNLKAIRKVAAAEESTEETEEETEEEPDEGKTENTATVNIDGDDLREVIGEAVRSELEKEKKGSLVNKLDNSKHVDFDRDTLEAMPYKGLKKLQAKAIPGVNFAAQAGSMEQTDNSEEEFVDLKPILTREGE